MGDLLKVLVPVIMHQIGPLRGLRDSNCILLWYVYVKERVAKLYCKIPILILSSWKCALRLAEGGDQCGDVGKGEGGDLERRTRHGRNRLILCICHFLGPFLWQSLSGTVMEVATSSLLLWNKVGSDGAIAWRRKKFHLLRLVGTDVAVLFYPLWTQDFYATRG